MTHDQTDYAATLCVEDQARYTSRKRLSKRRQPVNHSQRLNRPPVDSWAVCKCDGEVVAAHCTCMAGNGDACSHVAALLFYVEYGVRVRQERSCTDSANSWLPTHIRKLDVRPSIAEMYFASSTMKNND
ncbi:hypothetical protein HPB52_022567 [Rhipicephalus sanguineus]|uniref:SWIM-type domain-containing protein n=1 Tax=Rhipicephalus sanguineus TaxID=34632 RepID=A0A9D4PGT9_RHISA|nr:hypothetical protein HPB52_022567 [Rhipicephalus sanguineus]